MKWIISILEDERLYMCEAFAYATFVKTVMILRNSPTFGKMNYTKLKSMLRFDDTEMDKAFEELVNMGLLRIKDNKVIQDEMIAKKRLHDKRSSAGRKGGQNSLARYHSDKASSQTGNASEDTQSASPSQAFDNPPPAPAPPPKPSQRPPKPSYGLVEFKSDLKSLGISEQTINDWIENRRLKRLATTKTVFEAVKRELLKDPRYTPEQQLQFAVVKGWGGYKLEWFINEIRDTGVDYGNTNNPTSVGKPEKIPERNYDVPMF